MKLSSLPIFCAYLILVIAFLATNLLRIPYKDSVSWPMFSLHHAETQQLSGLAPSGLLQLDNAQLQSSVNRLSSVRLLREFGNSVRILLGQRIDWIIWGGKKPLMLFPTVDLWVSRGLTPEVRSQLTEAAVRISGYQKQLQAEGWTLIVVPVPTKLGIQRELATWPIEEQDLLTRTPVLDDRSDDVYEFLHAQLNTHGVHNVDLQTLFREAVQRNPSGCLLYAPNDSHWSGRGIELASRATAEAISASTPLASRIPVNPSYLEYDHVGDLVKSFDPVPGLTSWLTSAWVFHDHLLNGEQGRGYVYPSEPIGLVVAVGTSYTGQYTWIANQPVGFAWQLGLHLENTEVQNRPIAGKGSMVAFETFLKERNEIAREFASRREGNRPKVVVWEFPIRDVQGVNNIGPGQ